MFSRDLLAPSLLLFPILAAPVAAQSQRSLGTDSVTVVPGKEYRASGIHRFFFGSHYRDLWVTPVRVPVLSLRSFAGGLTPMRKGGGQQTKSLRFKGANGREYSFRSVSKNAAAVLPPDLRETFAERIFQDQLSSGHPVGPLVVAPLLTAAGVLHAVPYLVVLPDDPALREFRAEFANLLGTIEERPKEADDEGMSFAGAKEIVSSDELYKRLDKDPSVRVDTRQFLLARLTDVFLGDWDRHRDQWRWALFEEGGHERWIPIPRDRDQAFVRFDGLLPKLVRRHVPQLLDFGPEYGPIVGATWNGRDLDRRLLTELERSVWDSVAQVLQSRLSDAAIESAVAELPPEYRPIDGPRLTAALRHRRDAIPAMAGRYYRLLAGQVDVYGSDRRDVAVIDRVDRRYIDVTLSTARAGGAEHPYFHRRFDTRETSDLRIYLQGGDDYALVRGDGSGPAEIRLMGGGGDDRLVDSSRAGGARFYDSRGENTAVGHKIDSRPYRAIDDTTKATALPHRDWGRRTLTHPVGAIGPDIGLFFGFGSTITHWGFRRKPYASRLSYRVGFSTGATTGRIELEGRFQRENSRAFFNFEAKGSGIEVLRWYGFGNETTVDATRPISFYRVTQHQVSLDPSFGWYLGEKALLTVGPTFKFSATELDQGKNTERFIGQDRPYGAGSFSQVGARVELRLDSRDVPSAAQKGWLLDLGASGYPAVFDVEKPFVEIHAEASTYLTARMPTSPTLALLAGAQKVWAADGKIPFHEAAILGTGHTLRGYRSDRFAGEDAVYGTAELRLQLTHAFIFVPGQQGVFGFGDVGRVFYTGETSDVWHTSIGGGIWLAFLNRASLVNVAVGHSREGNRIRVRAGFAF